MRCECRHKYLATVKRVTHDKHKTHESILDIYNCRDAAYGNSNNNNPIPIPYQQNLGTKLQHK